MCYSGHMFDQYAQWIKLLWDTSSWYVAYRKLRSYWHLEMTITRDLFSNSGCQCLFMVVQRHALKIPYRFKGLLRADNIWHDLPNFSICIDKNMVAGACHHDDLWISLIVTALLIYTTSNRSIGLKKTPFLYHKT